MEEEEHFNFCLFELFIDHYDFDESYYESFLLQTYSLLWLAAGFDGYDLRWNQLSPLDASLIAIYLLYSYKIKTHSNYIVFRYRKDIIDQYILNFDWFISQIVEL